MIDWPLAVGLAVSGVLATVGNAGIVYIGDLDRATIVVWKSPVRQLASLTSLLCHSRMSAATGHEWRALHTQRTPSINIRIILENHIKTESTLKYIIRKWRENLGQIGLTLPTNRGRFLRLCSHTHAHREVQYYTQIIKEPIFDIKDSIIGCVSNIKPTTHRGHYVDRNYSYPPVFECVRNTLFCV